MVAFQRLAEEFQPDMPTGMPHSTLLARIAQSFPKIKESVSRLLSEIDIRKARTDKPEDMFKNVDTYPKIAQARQVGYRAFKAWLEGQGIADNSFQRPLRIPKPCLMAI